MRAFVTRAWSANGKREHEGVHYVRLECEVWARGFGRPHSPVRAQLIVAPAHRGRTESCTLRILTDAFTGAHEEKREEAPRRGGDRRRLLRGAVGL